MEYLNEGLAILVGGIIVKIFDFFISNKKVRQDEFTKISNQYQKDNARLREENRLLTLSDKAQTKQIHDLANEMKELRLKIKYIALVYKENHDGDELFDNLMLEEETENDEKV